jgi:hypothetical protein
MFYFCTCAITETIRIQLDNGTSLVAGPYWLLGAECKSCVLHAPIGMEFEVSGSAIKQCYRA